MKALALASLSLLCLLPLPAQTDEALTDEALEARQIHAGREKAQPCTTCHGLDGLRQGGEMPAIGGRRYDELLYQLGRFRRADRFHPAMTLLLQTFDVADMADVAAYFASVDRDRATRSNPYVAR
ncbi:MAG TPA: hypothetical protein PKH69_00050 [Thiobacillaceae bacterium]|nr:hypothetical protein [Thiobacillaceae bacterium]HNU63495.1 hypothetical protein [Thiobacillaceae bacterium]